MTCHCWISHAYFYLQKAAYTVICPKVDLKYSHLKWIHKCSHQAYNIVRCTSDNSHKKKKSAYTSSKVKRKMTEAEGQKLQTISHWSATSKKERIHI